MGESPKYFVPNIIQYSGQKMVDWARSPEQGCVNSIYRDAHHF
jgi:hypothetical protein